jgi:predicted N-acetyltransferase YhbS
LDPGVQLIEFGELTEQQRLELEGEEADPFEVGEITLQFRPKLKHAGLQDADGTLVASAGWVMAEAEVGEESFEVVGIGGVIVRAEFRGRGLAREIVEAAIERARTPTARFVLLFCRPDRAGLYLRLGFHRVEGDVLVEQPAGYVPIPLETMWRALSPGDSWPQGQLILHSLPF